MWLEEIVEPKALIQIGILSVLFFIVLYFIRGTRGAAILKGVIVFAVLAFAVLKSVAVQFKLQQLDTLLAFLLSISGFGLVAIFAPELRRGLSRLAEGPGILGGRSREEKTVRDIVEASFEMAKKRIGALITLERDVALDDLIEATATKIDAAITPQFLQTLFYPGNPLHDGAVVIREGKVAAAGVVMPLTQNPNIPKELGTRHRAAIGVTEETDALAVVVSEETGRVSLCVRGQITLGADRSSLQESLMQYFRKGGDDRGLRGLIRATRRKLGPWQRKDGHPAPETEEEVR
jgi:diadenylate cyclase